LEEIETEATVERVGADGNRAGEGQATEGKSRLKGDEGGHGDMQILHGDGAFAGML
jgi:hypothetical protein